MRRAYGLDQRLAEIAGSFFQAKLGIRPQRIEVLQEAKLITLRIRGFLTQAEAAMVGSQRHRQALTTYYERILENLYPLLRVVVQELCKRPVVDRRLVLHLPDDEFLYLLALGEEPAGR